MLRGNCLCGGASWELDGELDGATACNCTACRRYGALWAYGYENVDIRVSGTTTAFRRNRGVLGFHFCPECGCVTWWRGTTPEAEGIRIAVNLRLADPGSVAAIPIDHFDGLDSFDDLPRDGRCVRDLWS
jgi:hypothetical protein